MRIFSKKLSNKTKQTTTQKQGEIAYRERLVKQQILSKAKYFDDHKQNVEEILESWTRSQLSNLSGPEKIGRILLLIIQDMRSNILSLY